MSFNMEKFILSKHPDYDVNRYHFNAGDVVKLNCGAVFIVRESAIDWVDGYIHKRSLVYRNLGHVRIYYKDLPYFPKNEFVPYHYTIQKKLKWSVGDVVEDVRTGMIAYLYEESGPQGFLGFCLKTDQPYYLHTRIYLDNPYKHYFYA